MSGRLPKLLLGAVTMVLFTAAELSADEVHDVVADERSGGGRDHDQPQLQAPGGGQRGGGDQRGLGIDEERQQVADLGGWPRADCGHRGLPHAGRPAVLPGWATSLRPSWWSTT